MAASKETAEEQLLRMIEGPGGPRAPKSPLRGMTLERFLEQFWATSNRLRRWMLPARLQERSDRLLWRLRVTERLFALVLAALSIYLIADVFFLQRRPPSLRLPPLPVSAEPADAVSAEAYLKAYAQYRDAIVSRNPFGTLQGGGGGEEGASSAADELLKLTGSLTVVGINRGRVPEALIEDTTAQRTHFVKVGDQFNGLTVKAITEQGVVVSYEGEETTLR